jgi:hypothetical protein
MSGGDPALERLVETGGSWVDWDPNPLTRDAVKKALEKRDGGSLRVRNEHDGRV